MSDPKDKHKAGDPVVYIPANTVVNIGNDSMPKPDVQYEDRRWEYKRDSVKKIIGGIWGHKHD